MPQNANLFPEAGMRVAKWFLLIWIPLFVGCCQAQDLELNRGRMDGILTQVSRYVEKNYYDPSMHGVDWRAATEESRQRIHKAGNVGEMVTAIFALLRRLDDSHTIFIPPGRTQRALYGFEGKAYGDLIMVSELKKGGPAEKAGVKLGDVILGVNGFRASRDSFDLMMIYYRVLAPNMALELTVQRPGGPLSIQIPTKLEPQWAVVEFNTWTFNEWLREIDRPVTFEYSRSADGVAYLKVPTFNVEPSQMDGAVKKVAGASALVLDLRGNHGGAAETMEALVGALEPVPADMAEVTFRDKKETLKPKGHVILSAPLVILVDSESASASEVVARALQLEHRAIVVGDRTSGSVNLARFEWMKIGSANVVDFGVETSVGRLVMSDGQELERRGVTPDKPCLPTPDEVAQEKDPCKIQALALAKAALPPATH